MWDPEVWKPVVFLVIILIVLHRVLWAFFHGPEEDCPHCGLWLGDPEHWHAEGKVPPAYGGPRTPIQCPNCRLIVNRPAPKG